MNEREIRELKGLSKADVDDRRRRFGAIYLLVGERVPAHGMLLWGTNASVDESWRGQGVAGAGHEPTVSTYLRPDNRYDPLHVLRNYRNADRRRVGVYRFIRGVRERQTAPAP